MKRKKVTNPIRIAVLVSGGGTNLQALIDAEKDMIIKALERHKGKRKYAAQDLHISERTLYRKIKEYGIE